VASTHERLTVGGAGYSESYVNLSQRLEWPGLRSARADQAGQTAAAAGATAVADSARLAFQVKAAWVDALRAEETLRIVERIAEVFRESDRSAAERLGQGDISPYERRRIQVERLRYENLVADAELDAAATRRRLALLVVPSSDDAELAPASDSLGMPPTVGQAMALATAAARRPELLAAEAGLRAAMAGVTLAGRERLPDVTATGGYKTQSDDRSGAFLGISIPLPLWDRRGGASEAADARLAAAMARRDLAQRQVENDVLRAMTGHRSLAARARRLGGGVDVDLLAAARTAYAEGEMELIELLDAADAYHSARMTETRLRADLWISYHDLERAIGGYDAPGTEPEDAR
jgi:cobalt-zinc-cadmium efflux system outer membrane protein